MDAKLIWQILGDAHTTNTGHKSLMRRVDKRFCLSGQVLDTHPCMVAQKEMVLFVQMGANGLELLIKKGCPNQS
jgi:hypothetical protein